MILDRGVASGTVGGSSGCFRAKGEEPPLQDTKERKKKDMYINMYKYIHNSV